jgi:hypothetical protein
MVKTMTLDDDLRAAFERERKREAADPAIEARRADVIRRLAEVDLKLLKAFEKERHREAADPTIQARRADALRRLAEADERRVEEERRAEEKWQAEAERTKAAHLRLLYFEGSGPARLPSVLPKSGKLVDRDSCPHLITSGYCDQCGHGDDRGPSPYEVALVEELHATAHDPNVPIEFCTRPTCRKLHRDYFIARYRQKFG